MPKSQQQKDEQQSRAEEVLRRMLNTPHKPRPKPEPYQTPEPYVPKIDKTAK